MANSDYIQSGTGSFSTLIVIDNALDYLTDTITFTEHTFDQPNALADGGALMVDEEVMRIVSAIGNTVVVKRGCADTVPALHAAGAIGWLLTGSIGFDPAEHSASESVSSKTLPFTLGGGSLPISAAAPDAVTFNWRFFRPYPPAAFKTNGQRWYETATVSAEQPALFLEWRDRNRVLQADQLVGHDDATMAPEEGTTYTMRAYNDTGALVRTEVGLVGNSYSYQLAQITHDLNNPPAGGLVNASIEFESSRDDFASWQKYTAPFSLLPSYPLSSLYMDFARRVDEAPYVINLMYALTPDGNTAMAMAARPSDRQSDMRKLYRNDVPVSDDRAYSPWLTIDFKLQHLETTVVIRSSSLYDGVRIDDIDVGDIGLIGNELVEVTGVGPKEFTIARGCADTVPATHMAGSRMWFITRPPQLEANAGTDDELVTFKIAPVLYGPPPAVGDMPANVVRFSRRAERPYPPGQLVVNSRPWFEEAQATDGGPLLITWARRNRVTQGVELFAHDAGDVPPEGGQVTRVTIYYETPSSTPGDPAVQNVLRYADVAGLGYTYTYASALNDGNTAGLATGTCGTVVIYARIEALLNGLLSMQSYIIPIRVPSYPCAA